MPTDLFAMAAVREAQRIMAARKLEIVWLQVVLNQNEGDDAEQRLDQALLQYVQVTLPSSPAKLRQCQNPDCPCQRLSDEGIM